MTAIDKDTITTCLRNAIALDPKTISQVDEVDLATEISAGRGNLRDETQLVAEGLGKDYRHSYLTVLADWSGSPPRDGQTVTVDGTVYRVLRARTDGTDVGYRIDVGDKFQRGPDGGG